MKFLLEPDPDYKPINRFAASFQHVHATLWVDEAQAQFARLEARHRHGHSVWRRDRRQGLSRWPRRDGAGGSGAGHLAADAVDYDVDGRKFVFAFDVHERTEITRYRRVGPPPQAVEIMRNELNNLTAVSPAR